MVVASQTVQAINLAVEVAKKAGREDIAARLQTIADRVQAHDGEKTKAND